MKVKTSELSGEAINWAAAESLGFSPEISVGLFGCHSVFIGRKGMAALYSYPYILSSWRLFEESCTAFHRDPDGTCWATVGLSQCSGSYILEAFLRALVTERSGKEVDVPDELVREDKE